MLFSFLQGKSWFIMCLGEVLGGIKKDQSKCLVRVKTPCALIVKMVTGAMIVVVMYGHLPSISEAF